MSEGAKLFVLFGGGALVLGARWWLFHRVFGTPRADPTASPPLELDSTWLSRYGGSSRDPDHPASGGPT